MGSDPFYFYIILIFYILKGAPAPSFYLGTPDGGPKAILQSSSQKQLPKICRTQNCVLKWGTKIIPQNYNFLK